MTAVRSVLAASGADPSGSPGVRTPRDPRLSAGVAVVLLVTLVSLAGLGIPAVWRAARTFAGSGEEAVPTTRAEPAPPSLVDFFPIGVYVQPRSDFRKWVGRGINTVVEVPQGHDLEAWTAEAKQQGLRMIRKPRPDPAADVGEGLLLAWLQRDEPDLHGLPATSMKETYDEWKSIDPTRPVMLNVSGGHVLALQGSCGAACYRPYLRSADWISSDIYPVTGWNRPEQLNWVGRVVDRLRTWSGSPQFAFIETSHQNDVRGGGRGVTPGELRAQVWNAIIHGARGIWYFPVAFNPFRFDATPPAVVEEMTRQNELIGSLAPVLQGRVNPLPVDADVRAPLEVTWRRAAGKVYVIVLNLSDQELLHEPVTLKGISQPTNAVVIGEHREVRVAEGVLIDSFQPHGVHVYEIQE